MPERFLSGADSRFSDCALAITYNYTGNERMKKFKENAVLNINSDEMGAPVIENDRPLQNLRERFGIRRGGNFAIPVLLDLEQVELDDFNRAIQKSRNYILDQEEFNYAGEEIAAVAGQDIGFVFLEKPGVECSFGFVFRFEASRSWDEEHLQNNNIVLDERNPDIRKIVDINNNTITQEAFSVSGDRLKIEFSIDQDEITRSEVTAITNAVEGYARKAAENREINVIDRKLTVV